MYSGLQYVIKLYILFLMVTRSCKNSGLFLCIILKVSKAFVLILWVLNEGNLDKPESTFLYFLYFWGILFSTEVPGKRTVTKI
jgi:hypothetical protein